MSSPFLLLVLQLLCLAIIRSGSSNVPAAGLGRVQNSYLLQRLKSLRKQKREQEKEGPGKAKQLSSFLLRLKRTGMSAVHIVNKPLRDLQFWTRALHIYGSYKLEGTSRTTKKGSKQQQLNQSKSSSSSSRSSATTTTTTTTTTNNNTSYLETLHDKNSDRMMRLCLSMRGFYLKTGQFLGTRHDFMPHSYTTTLSSLHDNVPPPLGAVEVRALLEEELQGPLEQFFCSIDLERPIGAASIAQVHKGVWRESGEEVAIKIQYPHAQVCHTRTHTHTHANTCALTHTHIHASHRHINTSNKHTSHAHAHTHHTHTHTQRLMNGDLRNLRMLAEFLQRTELKVDLLSAIKELQK